MEHSTLRKEGHPISTPSKRHFGYLNLRCSKTAFPKFVAIATNVKETLLKSVHSISEITLLPSQDHKRTK